MHEGLQAAIARGADRLPVEEAIHIVQPPKQVLELLHHARAASNQTERDFPGYNGGPAVTEAQVKWAITSLNYMAVKAQERYDTKALDCKEFDANNQRVLEQIQQD